MQSNGQGDLNPLPTPNLILQFLLSKLFSMFCCVRVHGARIRWAGDYQITCYLLTSLLPGVLLLLSNMTVCRDPNGDGVPIWPEYAADAPSHLEFGGPHSFNVTRAFRYDYCDVWRSINRQLHSRSRARYRWLYFCQHRRLNVLHGVAYGNCSVEVARERRVCAFDRSLCAIDRSKLYIVLLTHPSANVQSINVGHCPVPYCSVSCNDHPCVFFVIVQSCSFGCRPKRSTRWIRYDRIGEFNVDSKAE